MRAQWPVIGSDACLPFYVSGTDARQRAHLTQSFPEFCINVVSNLQPCSFESAFTKPIQGATEDGDMVESAQQLVNHIQDFQCFLGSSSKDYEVIVLGTPTVMAGLTIPEDWVVASSLDEMIPTRCPIGLIVGCNN